MKQDSCAIVFEVTKPTGVRLDDLDRTIEPFGTAIANPVFAVAKQPFLMPSAHLDYFFDRLQTAAHGIARPGV